MRPTSVKNWPANFGRKRGRWGNSRAMGAGAAAGPSSASGRSAWERTAERGPPSSPCTVTAKCGRMRRQSPRNSLDPTARDGARSPCRGRVAGASTGTRQGRRPNSFGCAALSRGPRRRRAVADGPGPPSPSTLRNRLCMSRMTYALHARLGSGARHGLAMCTRRSAVRHMRNRPLSRAISALSPARVGR